MIKASSALGQFISRIAIHPLIKQNIQPIVVGYQRRRALFDKTAYNPQWIPRVKPYSKHRKPRQAQWDNPDVVFPQLIPPLHQKMNFRTYIKTYVQQQQKIRSFRKKQFLLEDIRAGDIIQISIQQTFESDKIVTHKALVLAFKRKKSLTALLQCVIRLAGVNIRGQFLIHSPMVRNIKLLTKGSGNLKANIKFSWRQMNRKKLSNPIIIRRVMKVRQGMVKKKRGRKQSGITFDRVQSDNVKRVR